MENNRIDPEALGKKLRVLRGIRTRAQVSRETGLSQGRIGNYEAGSRVPNDEAKVTLASYYGTTVQELFFEGDNNEKL